MIWQRHPEFKKLQFSAHSVLCDNDLDNSLKGAMDIDTNLTC
jgi:hypothetical protein